MKSIDIKIGAGSQDLIYTEIGVISGKKVQVSIRSDSYAFQSHAHIKVWDEANLSWNTVASIHHSLMKTPAKLRYLPQFSKAAPAQKDSSVFKADRDELVRLAKVVLS